MSHDSICRQENYMAVGVAGVQASCTSITRKGVGKAFGTGKGLVSGSGWGGGSCRPPPQGWSLSVRTQRKSSLAASCPAGGWGGGSPQCSSLPACAGRWRWVRGDLKGNLFGCGPSCSPGRAASAERPWAILGPGGGRDSCLSSPGIGLPQPPQRGPLGLEQGLWWSKRGSFAGGQ